MFMYSFIQLYYYIINTKLFYKFYELMQNKCIESKFNLAKNVKVNPRSSSKHSSAKVFKTVHEII